MLTDYEKVTLSKWNAKYATTLWNNIRKVKKNTQIHLINLCFKVLSKSMKNSTWLYILSITLKEYTKMMSECVSVNSTIYTTM